MPAKKDLVGQKFGKLTAVTNMGTNRNGKSIFECLCDCGRTKYKVIGGNLVQGLTESCGICVKTEDLIGKKFCNYTVVEFAGYAKVSRGKQTAMWLCRHDDGFEKTLSTASLNANRCIVIGKPPEDEEVAINTILDNYTRGARTRNYEYMLTREEFIKLLYGNCYYCGAVPNMKMRSSRSDAVIYYRNGIDRKVNTLGYTTKNTVSCCRACNIMKMNLNENDFIFHITQIIKHKGITNE